MPDLSGFPALDVAIGLVLMFFLLSTACSAINEAIAAVLGWRAKTLEDGLRSMLGDPEVKRGWQEWFGRVEKEGPKDKEQAKEMRGSSAIPADLTTAVLEQWPVRAVVRDPDSPRRRRRRPSYLPPHRLSLAVVEAIAAGPQTAEEGKSVWERTDDELFEAVQKEIQKLPDGSARTALQRAVAKADGTLDGFRKHIEGTFDDVMERASGWYKRKAQVTIFLIALAIAVGLNVDTVHVSTRLWNDQSLRNAVAAQAVRTAESGPSQPPVPGAAQRAADTVETVEQLKLPMGWGAGNGPDDLESAVRRVPGWLLTMAALMLGAPFWFDLLSRLARLRGSGVPEKPRSLSDTSGTKKDE
jgi:hypothetical protein